MKTLKNILMNLAILMILTLPMAGKAAGLVPDCNGTGCGWNELLDMINGVIKFALFKMAVPIAAIMFFYAGFLMVTAGGEAAEARTKAKGIFTNTIFGLVIALAAWLIISTILAILGYDGSWIGLLIKK